jgi:hypothetical protein
MVVPAATRCARDCATSRLSRVRPQPGRQPHIKLDRRKVDGPVTVIVK